MKTNRTKIMRIRPYLAALLGTFSLIVATQAAAQPSPAAPSPVIGEPVSIGPTALGGGATGAVPRRPMIPLGLDYTGCGGVTAPVINAAYDQRVVELTNLQRFFFNNLAPFKRNTPLDDASRYHSADMGQDDYFNHDTYDRSGGNLVFNCLWSTRITNYYGGFVSLSENIAAGQMTPDDAIAAWMNSSGHKSNMMSTSFHHQGAGYFCCAGTYTRYWTQDFGQKSGVYPVIINRENGTTTSINVNLYLYGNWTDMRFNNDGGRGAPGRRSTTTCHGRLPTRSARGRYLRRCGPAVPRWRLTTPSTL